MNTYSVLRINKNSKTEILIASNLTNSEAARLCSIPCTSVVNYSDKGTIANGTYIVAIDGEVEKRSIEKRWNNVVEAAEALKNGGKIKTVRKDGKLLRYVEAKA